MKKVEFIRRLERIGLLAVASLLMLGSGSSAFAQHHGGFHDGGFHSGGFHGFRGEGVRGGDFGGFRDGSFHDGSFGGFRGSGIGRLHGPGFYGGYRGARPYGAGGGWGPWWGLGLGLYLPMLPWYYTTFWWDDVPYYYVENDYYIWDPGADEYEQVQPPPEVAQQAQSGQQTQNGQQTQAPPQLYAYPKKGQTAQQQATDKRECSSWASAQTGLNPAAGTTTAQSGPGDGKASSAEPNQAGAAASANTPASAQQWQNYLRAEGACLEARGYTVE